MSDENRPSIFRKKSEEYIDSPEKLDHYLHVTSPGVWALLLAVIVLLIGVLAWSIMGRLETKTTVAIVSENGQTLVYVPQDEVESVVNYRKAQLDGQELNLDPTSPEAEEITESTNLYIRAAGKLNVGDIVYKIPVEESVKEGVYSGTVTKEIISPISLLLN